MLCRRVKGETEPLEIRAIAAGCGGQWGFWNQTRFKTQLPYLLAVWPWSNYLASLSFNTPINNIGVITSFIQSCQDSLR